MSDCEHVWRLIETWTGERTMPLNSKETRSAIPADETFTQPIRVSSYYCQHCRLQPTKP